MGFSFISAKVLEIDKKREIMYVDDIDGKFNYSWIFNHNRKVNIDFTIKNKSINENKIESVIGNKINKEFISFNYHGLLPSSALIKYPTKFSDGTRVNLYYYNDKKNKIEEIKRNIIVQNGYITFEIEHCSDYFIATSIVKEAERNNSGGIVIIGLVIVIVSLIGFTLFRKK